MSQGAQRDAARGPVQSTVQSHGSRRGRMRVAAIGVLAALVTSAVAVVGLAAPAGAATIDTDAWYVLVNRHSGKAMEVRDQSWADGAVVQQWDRNDKVWQQWQFEDVGSGWYLLRNRMSGKVLDVWEWSTADRADIRLYSAHGGANQQFRVADSDGDRVRLVNRHSGKAAAVTDWSMSNGATISQSTDYNLYNQQWELVRVGPADEGEIPIPGFPPPTTEPTTSPTTPPTTPPTTEPTTPPTTPPGDGECSGTYHAEAVLSGGTWTARNGGRQVYQGTDMRAAVQAAIGSLTPGRTSKERVVVRGSGSMSANSRISLPSHTALEVCGTINVTGSGSGDQAVVYSRGTRDVEVTRLRVTGTPLYGIFLRNVDDVVLGQIDLRLNRAGLGIRIDNHGDRSRKVRNVRIDTVYVQGTASHGVETYGVDGLTIGTVTARDTGYSGLLLNDTINATVGTVDAVGAGTGTGYAAFRMANGNGRIGSSYPTNIRVGTVRATGGGRGVFCVSESGGAVIDRVEISNTGNNPILIENCTNVSIATSGGTISGGEVRLAARTDMPATRDITLQNLTLTNGARVLERPCVANLTIRNVNPSSAITRC